MKPKLLSGYSMLLLIAALFISSTIMAKPKRVLVNHGEKSKSENVASNIYSRLRIRSSVPDNREIIKLR